MFEKIIINFGKQNLFQQLVNSTNFEDITKGRKGAVLVDNRNGLIPIVRTTTKYETPAQKFLPIHYELMKKINEKFHERLEFNNALIEIYNSDYCKMGFHTDQSLDLEKESYICLFSCYEATPDKKTETRKLKIKNKITNKLSEVWLENNSAILFSTSTNHKNQHKIVLEINKKTDNKWLGITFRLSKTFIKFIGKIPHLIPNNSILKIANNDERKEFYKFKGKENSATEFSYPEINYTISISDTMEVK